MQQLKTESYVNLSQRQQKLFPNWFKVRVSMPLEIWNEIKYHETSYVFWLSLHVDDIVAS